MQGYPRGKKITSLKIFNFIKSFDVLLIILLIKILLNCLYNLFQGTELTFNYKSSQQATKKAENRDDLDAGSSLPLIKQTLCHCGSDNCRIYLF